MKTTQLTAQTFDSAIASPTPTLVDFYADWCGPCKMLAPVLDELASEQAGQSVVAKLNIDDAPEIAARYGINAIPSLLVFKNGEVVKALRGMQPKSALAAALAGA